jgi:hypothetical protein
MSHATTSTSHQVLGRVRPAAKVTRPAAREPWGVAVAKVLAVLAGTVLLATAGMLLASVLPG